MELIQGTRKASKFVLKDVISKIPDNVVTNVLDRLPLQEAVRTGILSRNWRFKWTMLTQLVFDKKFYEYLIKKEGKDNYSRIISRLLLHLKGAITKFILYIDVRMKLKEEDINHWLLFLSRNGIKDLTLEIWNGNLINFPTHLFSCLELKHLKLISNCCFDPPAGFKGFPKLLSLEMSTVHLQSSKIGKFITLCPSLEILNMWPTLYDIFMITTFQRKVRLAELTNLKRLYLTFCHLDNTMITNFFIVFELVGILPRLQELDLDFMNCKFIGDGAEKRSLAVFPCLNALKLKMIDLSNDIMLSCAFELIRCSPNLQTLEITAPDRDAEPTSAMPISEVDYYTVKLLQLQSVVFIDSKCSKNEVCLIKYLLACSPFLEKIVIRPYSSQVAGEKLFARKLLKLHRASPVAEIDLY